MRVLAVSHAAVVGPYREKFRRLAARRGWDLHLVLPHAWPEGGADVAAPAEGREGKLTVHVLRCRLRGRLGFTTLAGLPGLIASLKPALVYAEEEPYGALAWQARRGADEAGAKLVFYTWENLDRAYKPPLKWLRAKMLARADGAVAGNLAAERLLRGWGYGGPLLVQPQFGFKAAQFRPASSAPGGPFTVGYFGRLVPEKGVDVLLKAAALAGVRVRLGGRGPQEPELKALAARLGADAEFLGFVPFERRMRFYRGLHALALPSLPTRRWEEQFGRVLAEAMACGVPCVGSDSGAIPEVLGDAGLVSPAGDAPALAACLARLRDERGLAARLARRGRSRSLARWTETPLTDGLGLFLEGLGKPKTRSAAPRAGRP
jgi:glycosyltransferase involved in cell wall biosynthesis